MYMNPLTGEKKPKFQSFFVVGDEAEEESVEKSEVSIRLSRVD